jgi:UDP-glucose 4-epimerase
MSQVLVTGAAGFIGSRGGRVAGIGHEIVALDDLSGGFEDNVPPRPGSSKARCWTRT